MNSKSRYAVVLAGGQGARFWPLSRLQNPKQFLSISDSGETLIQATCRRVQPLVGAANTIVVTNMLHEKRIAQEIPTATVLSEPVGRNTTAAIALAAFHIEKHDPGAIMFVLPADHAVSDEENLRATLARAGDAAEQGDVLVTIGIPPSRPDTAYGYIQRGDAASSAASFKVKRFYEKPSLARAKKYVESGDFYWNSGMFAWKASSFIEALKVHLSDDWPKFEQLAESLDTSQLPASLALADVYSELPSVSVDFAIMEHAKNVLMVEALSYGWNDVGSWDAWAEHFGKDEHNNLLHGDVVAIDSKDNVVVGNERFIGVVGAQDLVIIDSGDALLVCPRERVQDVRKIVDYLKERGRNELI